MRPVPVFLATLALVFAAAAPLRAQTADGGVAVDGGADGGAQASITILDEGPADAGVPGPSTADGGTPTGEAPSIPAGESPELARAPVPESGKLARVLVQGNRRVETDAIRAVLPLKAGDEYDRAKLKKLLLAVWK